MKLFLAILVALVAVAVAQTGKDEDLWKSYKSTFGKKTPPEKDLARKEMFIKRRKVIEKHNLENKEWKRGLNKFTDMSDEHKKIFLGAKMSRNRAKSIGATDYPVLDRRLPTSIDYRTHRCLIPVKQVDQGDCGSCWAFAANTPLEFNSCRKTRARIWLSEQMLVDCDRYNKGCNGGDFTYAWQYVKEIGGAVRSANYPYVSGTTLTNSTCKFSSSAVAVKVSSFDWVMPYPSENAIMARLQSDGPLPTSMKVLDPFFDYASGVYSDPACIVADENDVDHAVVIIGYGTTAATATVPATPYWIVRNSWGIGWGIKGNFLIKRGVNMCNIESWAAYVKVV
ncbi:procathepsin L-like [Daphnia pulicaria]|uniref:procathepsin L-like n=1 Tax=Daphnia pulicaria TaxID=35523 RepID=UPI001EECB66B|nr:procathepsin L-like [Daphnia pulicaria]